MTVRAGHARTLAYVGTRLDLRLRGGHADDVAPEPPPTADQPVAMSVRGATFLGIGSMVGAGIFALLGEAGAVAGAAVWLSFLVAGMVAGLLGYTAVKLGVRFPSS